MANPFYARYIPPSTTVVRQEPSAKSDSNPGQDPALSIKRRKTKSGFKAIVGSNEGPADIPDASEGLITETSVRISEVKKGEKKKKKKKKTEHDDNSYSLASSTPSKSVLDGEDQPLDSTLEVETPNIAVEGSVVKEREKKRKKERKKNERSSAAKSDTENTSLLSQNDSISDETKHKKIRAKYEKAAKASSQETEKVDAAMVEGLEEREPEHSSSIEIHGLVPLPQPLPKPDIDKTVIFSALPDWLTHPIYVSSSATTPLDSLSLSPSTLTSLKQKGYQDAFAIQAAVLPLLLPGSQSQHSGDLCISAATGSGKTLAYSLPLVANLRDKPMIRLRGLIVVPTRELVVQVRECLEVCVAGSGLKMGMAVGSKSLKEEQELLIEKGRRFDPDAYRAEKEKLSAEDEELMDWDIEDIAGDGDDLECLENYVVDYSSKVDIVVCTPGRLVDHMKSTKGFTLDHVQWLVIDEADRLLDESFQQWVQIVMPALEYQAPLDPINDHLLKTFRLSRPRKVRKVILSATMTRDIGKLTALKLIQPKMVILETATEKVESNNTPGSNHGQLASQNNIELPLTLKETAIPIGNTNDKPLHLIDVLQKILGLPQEFDQQRKSLTSPESSDTSSSDNDGESGYSSSASSRSSSPSFSHRSKSPKSNPQLPGVNIKPNLAQTYGTLIFTNNNENAIRLARLLVFLRPAWQAQIGTLTKSSSSTGGRRTLAQLRSRKLAIVIATDRASRGLDIPHLAHVINYDIPTSVTAYVHRVGRTARAGRDGNATTFVAKHEAHWFWNDIARAAGGIVRATGRKVIREESRLENWGKDERRAYAEALKRLGEEAKGF